MRCIVKCMKRKLQKFKRAHRLPGYRTPIFKGAPMAVLTYSIGKIKLEKVKCIWFIYVCQIKASWCLSFFEPLTERQRSWYHSIFITVMITQILKSFWKWLAFLSPLTPILYSQTPLLSSASLFDQVKLKKTKTNAIQSHLIALSSQKKE